MQGSLDTPPVIVRTSRRISFVGFLVCGVVLYFNLTSLIREDWPHQVQPYIWLYVSGLGLFYFVWQLIDPMTLRLAPDGLTWKNTFGSRHWSWEEISNFRKSFGLLVGCDLSSRNPITGWLRPINKGVSGSHGVLGFGWELGSAKLIELLNTARARWLSETSN